MKNLDTNTQAYRISQFKQVATVYSEYKPKIKIIKPNGETNWLDIEEGELLEIMKLLTQTEIRITHDGEYSFAYDLLKH